MNEIEQTTQSQVITALRFLLIIGVVFIHFDLSNGFNIQGSTYGTDFPDYYYQVINLVSNVLARVSVPLFFFISGYLLFYGKDFNRQSYAKILKSRTRTLLVPYLLWNLIAIIFAAKVFIPGLSSLFPGKADIHVHLSLTAIINTFFDNYHNGGIFVRPTASNSPDFIPINTPFWYVRDLMTMVLFSPVIYIAIRWLKGYWVVVLGVVWYFAGNMFYAEGGYVMQLINAAFFVSWGAYYSINKQLFLTRFVTFGYAPLAYLLVATTDLLTKGEIYNLYINKIGILVGIIAFVVVTCRWLKSRLVQFFTRLANYSFFVFALHYLIINDLAKMVFKMTHMQDVCWQMLLFYIIVPMLTITMCVLVAILLQRSIPRLYSRLCGSR